MATTSAVALTATGWALLFTAADPALTVGLQSMETAAVLLRVAASDPGAEDAARAGSLVMTGGSERRMDLTLDDGDKLWGRLEGGTGNVTVLG